MDIASNDYEILEEKSQLGSPSTSPPRKMRNMQELLDSTELIEYDDTIFCAFFVEEDPISFDQANKEDSMEKSNERGDQCH